MAENQKVDEGAASEPQEQVSRSIDDKTIQLLTEHGGKLQLIEKELRGLQGRQDKQENAFKTQFAEYDKLIKKGMSHDEAVSELENKQRETSTLADLQKQIADLAARVDGGQPKTASQEVVSAFEDMGLDPKDPRVIIEMQRVKDADEAVLTAYKLKKNLEKAPSPTEAQQPASQGSLTPAFDANKAYAELQMLYKNPSAKGNMARITELQAALKKAGN